MHRLGLALLACLLGLTFWLPTVVAPRFAWSDSYMFGFNNRLCEILFGVVILVTAAFAKGFGLRPPAGSTVQSTESGLSRRLLWICLTITAVGCGFFYWLSYSVGGVGDAAYFLDRIHLIARGEVPFRDFEFVYGSLSLYAAIFLGRVLHIGADNGYYLLWAAETLLGIVLLWYAILWLDVPAAGKRTVFLLYFVFVFLFLQGVTLNYCALRYTLPLFGLACVAKLSAGLTSMARARTVVAALVFAGLLIGLSPEEGLIFAMATVAYLPFRRFVSREPFLPDTAILLVGYVLLYELCAHFGSFGTMKRFGAGAFNLPFYPGGAVLFAVAAVLGMVCYLATGTLAERARSSVFLFTLYGVGMLPGAMGRCDAIHICGYLMAVLLCALLLCRRYPHLWRFAVVSFAIFFIVVPNVFNALFLPPTLSKALLNHLYAGGVPMSGLGAVIDRTTTRLAVRALGEQKGMEKMTALRRVGNASADPHKVFPSASPVISVPFEYIPNKVSNYQAPDVDEGYYMGLSNVVVPEQVQQRIAELAAHPEQDLVVSNDGFTQCAVHTGSRTALRWMLLTPFVPKPKQEVTMFVPYCTYIRTHYQWVQEPTPATFDYGLMRRKPD